MVFLTVASGEDDFLQNELQCGFEVRRVYVVTSFLLIYVIYISEDLCCSISIGAHFVHKFHL